MLWTFSIMPRGGFHQAFLLYETQPNSQLPPPQKPTPVRFPSPEPSSHFGSISQHLMEIPNQLTLCHVFGVDRATRHWPTPATAAKNSPPAIDPMHEHLVVSSRYHHSLGFLWRPLHVAGLFLVWRPIPWVVWGSRLATIFWNWKNETTKGLRRKQEKQTWLELHGHVSLFWFLGGFFTFCFRSFSLQREDFSPYFRVQSGKLQPFERRLSSPIDTLDRENMQGCWADTWYHLVGQ